MHATYEMKNAVELAKIAVEAATLSFGVVLGKF